MSEMRELSFAWTATEGYKHFPVYVNLTGNRLAVRGEEIFNGKHYEQGHYVAVKLPSEALAELRRTLSTSLDHEGVRSALTDEDLAAWAEQAKRDDWHYRFVASDIRQLIGEVQRSRAAGVG